MAVKNVDLTVSQLVNDLNSGMTWLKKDDLGYGSIEEKYGANPMQIANIRKHPSLKNAETNITIFNIIDDTIDETPNKTKEPKSTRTNNVVKEPTISVPTEMNVNESADAADIFANL